MVTVSSLQPIVQALKKQRRRLRQSWSNSKLETWSAHTNTIMDNVGSLHLLTKRLQDITQSQGSVSTRVDQVHDVLDSAIEILEENLLTLNESKVTHAPTPAQNINVTIPQTISNMQEQKIIQKVYVEWSMIESEIDGDEGIPLEKKEEAKGHARVIWDGLVNKSRDMATVWGAVNMLSQLGMHMDKIFTLFGIGG